MNIKEIINIEETISTKLFKNITYPWEVLYNLENKIIDLGKELDKIHYKEIEKKIWIGKNVIIDKYSVINPPCIIDDNTKILPFSHIKGSVIIGKSNVIGSNTEIKNSILFNDTKIPHMNYVGDSILGYNSHLGAGVKISNQKLDKTNIKVNNIDTNLTKLGAIIGDNVNVGCNAVLNPGTIIGKNTNIYPLLNIRGIIPQNRIIKTNDIENLKIM